MDGQEVTHDVIDRTPPRINFGDGEAQNMPLLWAERLIRWLYKERKQTFADGMLHVMGTGFTTRNERNGHR